MYTKAVEKIHNPCGLLKNHILWMPSIHCIHRARIMHTRTGGTPALT